MLEILFLGTGTSHGVPVVDCIMTDYKHCPKNVCKLAETDSKHNRTRSSVLLSFNEKHILIDCGTDFRSQVLREKIKRIDAALFTHRHSDHIGGIPDIRSYCFTVNSRTDIIEKPLPIYGSQETIDAISQAYSYIFNPNACVGGGIPSLKRNAISDKFSLFGLDFEPISVEHGDCNGCFGYRFADVAYIPDVKNIPPKEVQKLQNLDLLIIDCLRMERPHSTHFIYEDIKNLIAQTNPKKVLGTHLCHDINYETDEKIIDPRMTFAFDGLRVVV
ncbi:MAG: MBL fold metallo-hydrolase [Chitinivibrionia bacterium]|nr:MBL fold metallo-hydrolase [Chitinivibrionia bacterium]